MNGRDDGIAHAVTGTDPLGVTELADIAKALSEPIRLEILTVMAQGRSCCELPEPRSRGVPGSEDPGGICVCEFQEQFGLAQSKVSYHLRVLRDAGLIRTEARGKWTFYTIDREVAAAALRAFHRLLRA